MGNRKVSGTGKKKSKARTAGTSDKAVKATAAAPGKKAPRTARGIKPGDAHPGHGPS